VNSFFLFIFNLMLIVYPAAAYDALVSAGSPQAKARQLYVQAQQLLQQKQYQQAAGLLTEASKLGNKRAQYHLGLLYARGIGVTRDYIRARKWLGEAARQGHPKAQFFLGQMYMFGDGGAKDLETATLWFWLATSLGDRYAKDSLRVMTAKISATQFKRVKQRAKVLWKTMPQDMKVGNAMLMH